MKKTFCYICMTALLVAGCYKTELNQIDKEIDTLSSTEVASLDAQVKNIKESLDNLPYLSVELKDYIITLMDTGAGLQTKIDAINGSISALRASVTDRDNAVQADLLSKLEAARSSLETQLSTTRAVIDALQQKFDSLEEQTEGLEAYAEGQFATLDWVSGTFATLTRQNELIAEVEAIRSMLDGLSSVTVQINDDIKNFIDTEVQAAKEGAGAAIAAMVDEVTAAIAAAAQQTADSLTGAYSQELSDAITAVEEGVMSWVSNELDDYYTVAQAEAQILVFQTLIGDVPHGESLQGQIDGIAAQVESTKEKITEAYEKAIREAIENCEGILSDELTEMINDIRNNELKALCDDVDYLDNEISKLWGELGKVEIRINKLSAQVNAIMTSLAVLEELDKTLEEYVGAVVNELGKTDADNLDALTKLISALSTSPDGKSLKDEIEALKAFAGTIPTDDESISAWIENTFRTLENQYELYATIDYVEGLYKELNSSVLDHSERLATISSTLSTIIDDSKSTIEGWITDALSGYMDASTFDSRLADLESTHEELFAEGDGTLSSNISALSAKITSTMGELKTAYETAIETAITAFNGFVSDEVKKVFDEADGKIVLLDAEVTGIETTIAGIKNDINSLNKRITTAKNDIATLQNFIKDYSSTTFKALMDDLKAKVDALPTTYASLSDFNTVNATVNGENGYASTVAKLAAFVTDLAAAEQNISDYKAMFGEFNLSGESIDNLKDMMDAVLAEIATLQGTVFGESGSDSLREQLDDLLDVKDDILSDLLGLEGKMLKAADFASIAYVPEYADGMATFKFTRKTSFEQLIGNIYIPITRYFYECNFNFEVRPRQLASAVANAASMYYIGTPTRALGDWMTAFDNYSIKGDNNTGIVTASVTASVLDYIIGGTGTTVNAGASAVLVVENGDYEFASEFIPIRPFSYN